MKYVYIKKLFKFECSHRLLNHPTKCKNIHGHNYKVWIHIRSSVLDDLGMVVDFGHLTPIKKWLDDNWDHALVYNAADTEIDEMVKSTKFKTFKLPTNPTAENMCIFLAEKLPSVLLNKDLEIYKIEVFENDESVAYVVMEDE